MLFCSVKAHPGKFKAEKIVFYESKNQESFARIASMNGSGIATISPVRINVRYRREKIAGGNRQPDQITIHGFDRRQLEGLHGFRTNIGCR
jgi:hypothetical protein